MTALKLYGNTLLANARVSASAGTSAARCRSRTLVVRAAKASPPAIKQGDFVEKLSTELGIPQTKAKDALKKVLDLISEEVSAGNKVSFQG